MLIDVCDEAANSYLDTDLLLIYLLYAYTISFARVRSVFLALSDVIHATSLLCCVTYVVVYLSFHHEYTCIFENSEFLQSLCPTLVITFV